MLNPIVEICAFIICMLLLYFDKSDTNNKTNQYKIYKIGHCLIISNIIIETIRIVLNNYCPQRIILQYVSTLIFHITNCLIFFVFVLYAISLSPKCNIRIKKHMYFCSIPYVIISFLIFTSPITKIVYYVENQQIVRGPLFSLSFMAALMTFFIVFIYTFVANKRDLTLNQKQTIFLILIIPFIITVIEFYLPTIPLNGFSYAASLLIMYFSFYISGMDSYSGGKLEYDYRKKINALYKKNKYFSIFYVQIKNMDFLKNAYPLDKGKIFFNNLYNIFNKNKHSCEIYALPNNTFAFVSNISKDEEIEHITKEIKKELQKRITLNNVNVSLSYLGYVVKCVSLFDKIEDVEFVEKDSSIFTQHNDFIILNGIDKEKIEKEKIIIKNIIEMVDEFDFYDATSSLNELNTNLVEVYYQPILNNMKQKFLSAEALMRLNIKELGGIVYPDKFIPFMENKKFLHRFSRIVLVKVCEFIKELENENKEIEGISVNFSLDEFVDDNFENDIITIVNQYRINPNKIHIEITETINNDDKDTIKEKMLRLKNLGFKFYLDDFGTGYSNFAKLVDLPFDVIKFDRSLINKAIYDEKMYDIISSLSIMMLNNDFEVLYEGVETVDEEKLMKQLKISFGQGYKYSKPIPKESVINFFNNITP